MNDDVAEALTSGALCAPKLIASDLDGTLLRSDGTFSERTAAAVEAIQVAGVGWVVATARPPRWLHDLTDVIGRDGVALCSNGAYVYDVPRQRIVAERTLAIATLHEIVDELRTAVPDIAFAVERSDGFGREPSYEDVHREADVRSVATVVDLFHPLPGKLLARSPGSDHDEFLQTVERVVGKRAVVAYSGTSGLAEISASGVTKAAVLATWCEERGLTCADVWAFGDMPNDVPMLAWAGTAFAVANAHSDVLAIANHVVASSDDDGVAQVLEQLLAVLPEAGRDVR